jgi:rod shape determining protein RodA
MFCDRSLLREIDYILLVAVLLLVAVGFLVIYSATRANTSLNGGDPFYFVKKQGLWVLMGFAGFILLINIDYRALERFYQHIYMVNILSLGAVMVMGGISGGAQRWLSFGGMRLQPSEFAKLAIIITLAHLLARESEPIDLWKVAASAIHVGIPMILVLRQPDLGTAIVFVAIFFGMLYMAGAPKRILAGFLVAGLFASLLAYFFVLEPYQKKRLVSFLNPAEDPLGVGYNVIQSKIAIGSGQILGKGPFAGTQIQLSFLPARHTDFIFSVVGEEFGFIGAIFVLALYSVLIWRAFLIVGAAKDEFGRLMATGITCAFIFQIFVNIGMTMGIMPVTGIPLPFLSYGGSATLTNLISIALLTNIGMRRRKLTFK